MQENTDKRALRPKIILIRNTNPKFYGGGETYQLILSNALAMSNFIPFIFTSSKELLNESHKHKVQSQKTPFLKMQNWSGFKNFLLPIYFLWQIYLYFWYKKQFRKIKPQTVIIESRDDYLSATYAAKRMHIRVLWIDHMDFRSWVLQNTEKKYKNFIGKAILKVAKAVDQIIFISDYERRFFEQLIKKTSFKTFNNLVTIKNGAIDSFNIYKDYKPTLKSIIYLGRLEEYKGIKELITAFSNVAPQFKEARLHIYGTGTLADFCKKSETSQIIYHGFTDRPLDQIAQSSIFVLPSYREGLSLSLIDATMLGKAIIATDVDGNPEVVEHQKNGLLIPAKDTKALSNALIELLSNPKLVKQFGKASRRKYLAEFNFQRTVKTQLIPLLKDNKDE